jgi:hypothetical protein
MVSQRRSDLFPEEINMLLLSGIEPRSPGNYSVADHYIRGVQIKGLPEPNFMRKVRKLTISIKLSCRFFVGLLLVSFHLATNSLVSVTFE